MQVIRAADLYLAPVGEQVLLVGVDVSVQSLLRRLGPKRLRGRPTPDRVIDWDAVAPFADQATDGPATVRLRDRQAALHRLRPGELADLLEDLIWSPVCQVGRVKRCPRPSPWTPLR
ncbi:hypothetical protein [Pseudonocardia sp. GCM10023141]|uniref:hypothetical protein n=1 Tax=Pseudonocardia sp. GCM10023141 TaxID=3252653 RepID=UPI003615E480